MDESVPALRPPLCGYCPDGRKEGRETGQTAPESHSQEDVSGTGLLRKEKRLTPESAHADLGAGWASREGREEEGEVPTGSQGKVLQEFQEL